MSDLLLAVDLIAILAGLAALIWFACDTQSPEAAARKMYRLARRQRALAVEAAATARTLDAMLKDLDRGVERLRVLKGGWQPSKISAEVWAKYDRDIDGYSVDQLRGALKREARFRALHQANSRDPEAKLPEDWKVA